MSNNTKDLKIINDISQSSICNNLMCRDPDFKIMREIDNKILMLFW
jgi:hypothetical protein